MVVSLVWQWVSLHDGNPKVADQKELLARDREHCIAARIDLPRIKDGCEECCHAIKIPDDEGDMAETFDHGYPPLGSNLTPLHMSGGERSEPSDQCAGWNPGLLFSRRGAKAQSTNCS